MTVKPTDEKVTKIAELCQSKLSQPMYTIRELARLIGNIVATFTGVQYGPLHYREMEKLKFVQLKHHKGNFDKTISLTRRVYIELRWWFDRNG